MKRKLQAAALLSALIIPVGCSGTRNVGLPGNTTAGSSSSQHVTTHYAAVRAMPPVHLAANAKEYQYDIVGVTFGTRTRAFMVPQRVTTDASGVTVVDLAGRTFSFPSGSVVSHGSATYYLLLGAKRPAWLARAKYVRTLTRADI
ncbi:MAG TPA: hypothetical protein VK665_16410 [Candidatus Elarobacter sp.]|nr:hypothetical protein [Candidatus Elarobacter sp.]